MKKLKMIKSFIDELDILQKDINDLNRMAMLIASKKSESKLIIEVNDLEKEEKKDILDADGSLKPDNYDEYVNRIIHFHSAGNEQQSKADESFIEDDRKGILTLEIIGCMLYHKEYRKQELINKLKALKIKI